MTAAERKILSPFNPREAIPLRIAAKRAGKEYDAMRRAAIEHGLGRRERGSVWQVSQIALAMWADGNWQALAAYHRGIRGGPLVAPYFQRLGLADLIDRGPIVP